VVNYASHCELDGDEWSASCPSCFTSRERGTNINWIGGWVVPRASLVAVAKRRKPLPAPAGNLI